MLSRRLIALLYHFLALARSQILPPAPLSSLCSSDRDCPAATPSCYGPAPDAKTCCLDVPGGWNHPCQTCTNGIPTFYCPGTRTAGCTEPSFSTAPQCTTAIACNDRVKGWNGATCEKFTSNTTGKCKPQGLCSGADDYALCSTAFLNATFTCASALCRDLTKCQLGDTAPTSLGNVCFVEAEQGECPANTACSPVGDCKKVRGQSCMLGSDCLSTFCQHGVCCDVALCGGECRCDRAGSRGVCSTDIGGPCDGLIIATDVSGELMTRSISRSPPTTSTPPTVTLFSSSTPTEMSTTFLTTGAPTPAALANVTVGNATSNKQLPTPTNDSLVVAIAAGIGGSVAVLLLAGLVVLIVWKRCANEAPSEIEAPARDEELRRANVHRASANVAHDYAMLSIAAPHYADPSVLQPDSGRVGTEYSKF
jgi:hypothetical protein